MIFNQNSKAVTGENPEALLTCFFSGCNEHFGFLKQHGFTSVSGLGEQRKGRKVLSPFRAPGNITPPFEAVTLFEKDATALEITYGGENYMLDFHICYGHVHRFLLREVFQAARKPVFSKLDPARAPTIKALESTLLSTGKTLRKNVDFVTDINPKILERTLTIHDKLIEENLRARNEREIDEAAKLAAKAFMERDYPRVIAVLSPYESYLSASGLKKLDLARKILLNV